MMDGNGPANELIFPAGSSYHGSELYREPFRWDQRLHVLLLKFASGSHAHGNNGIERSNFSSARFNGGLAQLAQATGGSFTAVSSMGYLVRTLDSLNAEHSSRKPPCVSIDFEPLASSNGSIGDGSGLLGSTLGSPPPPSTVTRIQVRAAGVWPFPEDFVVSPSLTTLPPRSALPKIWFKSNPVPMPRSYFGFPADMYDLDATSSSLSQWIAENVPKGQALECFANADVSESRNSQEAANSLPPFALLVPSPEGIKLMVLAYNYPAMNALLSTYQNRTARWKLDFEKYVASLPPYYVGPLKTTLKQLNLPNTPLLSGHVAHPYNLIMDTQVASCKELPSEVATWLSEMKTRAQAARASHLSEIATARKSQAISQQTGASSASAARDGSDRFDRAQLLLQIDVLRSRFTSLRASLLPTGSHSSESTSAMDVYSLRRLDHRHADDDAKHHVPISEMGDFQTYLAKKPPPLKSIDESATQVGKPYFGNPFTKGDAGAFVDEVGVSGPAGAGGKKPKKRKRKFEISERADKFKQFMTSDQNGSNGSSGSPLSSHASSANSSPSNSVPGSPWSANSGSTTASPNDSPRSSTPSSPSGLSTPTSPNLHSTLSSTNNGQAHSASSVSSSGAPGSSGAPHPPKAPANASVQSYANLQKTRKEQIQKWERAQQQPSGASQPTSAASSQQSTPLWGSAMAVDAVPPTGGADVRALNTPLFGDSLLQCLAHNHSLTLRVIGALRKPHSPDEQTLRACCTELRGPSSVRAVALQEWTSLASNFRVDTGKIFQNANM